MRESKQRTKHGVYCEIYPIYKWNPENTLREETNYSSWWNHKWSNSAKKINILKCYETLQKGHLSVWSEVLEKASLRKPHSDLKNKRRNVENTRNVICKGLFLEAGIASLRLKGGHCGWIIDTGRQWHSETGHHTKRYFPGLVFFLKKKVNSFIERTADLIGSEQNHSSCSGSTSTVNIGPTRVYKWWVKLGIVQVKRDKNKEMEISSADGTN